MEREPGNADGGTGSGSNGAPAGGQRRFGGSRLVPRVEFGRQPPAVPPAPRPDAEPVDEDAMTRDPFGGQAFSPLGTPREFAGGRVRVYGCSPGCLVASLVASLFLTLLLNAMF
jgi:hypothetical protein